MNRSLAQSLYRKAQERLAAGTVTLTQYGVRVECRAEFGDDRSSAKAYWPKRRGYLGPWICRCYAFASNGGLKGAGCSHIVAAQIMEGSYAVDEDI